MNSYKFFSILVLLFSYPLFVSAQIHPWIEDVVVRIDTTFYSLLNDSHDFMGEPHLFVPHTNSSLDLEIRIYPKDPDDIAKTYLIPTITQHILAEPIVINNEYIRSEIHVDNFTAGEPTAILYHLETNADLSINKEIRILPYRKPILNDQSIDVELFEGEERSATATLQNAEFLSVPEQWIDVNSNSYRFEKNGDGIKIQLKSSKAGNSMLYIPLQNRRPFLDDSSRVTFTIDTLTVNLTVKPSRLRFLYPSQKVIFMQVNNPTSEEIELDYARNLQLKKVYRIENQQSGNGRLLAELIPKTVIGDRILCDIIPYSLHNAKDGYLYIKENGKSLYVSNLTIANFPKIERIKLLREGGDWTENLRVFPGDSIEVRIEGSGLSLTEFTFEGSKSTVDSVRRSNQTVFYTVQIPKTIARRRISVFMNKTITPYELLVQEFERPAPFDFVLINYDGTNQKLTDDKFNRPVFYDGTIDDIVIGFERAFIDNVDNFNGRQHLEIDVKVLDSRNALIDLQSINNITVVPDETSLRHSFYDSRNSFTGNVNLNDNLIRKTYDLTAFARVEITIRHNQNRYSDVGYRKKITLILRRKTSLDVQISFPAGLLVKEFNQSGVGQLSGISTSAVAQIGFYDPERLGQFRPFKLGVGFVAINAFNFSDDANVNRDVGLVFLGSFEPVKNSARVSFPLYLGFGYLIDANTAFAIMGPGIQVRF